MRALIEKQLARAPNQADPLSRLLAQADGPVSQNLLDLLSDAPTSAAVLLGLVERSLELRPDSDSAWDTLAELRFRLGDLEEALEAIARAAALNPENAELYERRRLKYDAARGE